MPYYMSNVNKYSDKPTIAFYTNNRGVPGDRLVSENFTGKKTVKKGWNTIRVYDSAIAFPENGCFLALEWASYVNETAINATNSIGLTLEFNENITFQRYNKKSWFSWEQSINARSNLRESLFFRQYNPMIRITVRESEDR